MKNEAKEVVSSFLTAVQEGDIQTLGTLLHPDVKWSQAGNNALSGTKNSAGEVFQMVGKMFELSHNTLKLTDIKSLSVSQNRIACVLHWCASQPQGNNLDVDNIDVYTVENGKITNVEIFTVNEEMENIFWGK